MEQFKVISSCKIGKSIQQPEKSQDALATNPEIGLFAVSDGVANSIFPEIWAELLVNHFCMSSTDNLNPLFNNENISSWLSPIQKEWVEKVKKVVSQLQDTSVSNVRFLRQEAAIATFVGLQLYNTPTQKNKFRAIIVGDSVLFHLRNSQLLKSYTITESSRMGNKTNVLASYPNRSDSPSFISGEWIDEDEFIIATDAIAKWLLVQIEKSQAAWNMAISKIKELRGLGFIKFVQNQQNDSNNPLGQDDITLLVISAHAVSQEVETNIRRSQIELDSRAKIPVPRDSQDIVAKNYYEIRRLLERIDFQPGNLSEIQKTLKEIANSVEENTQFLQNLNINTNQSASGVFFPKTVGKNENVKKIDSETTKILEKLSNETVNEIQLKKILDSIAAKIEQNAEKQLSVLNMIAAGKEFDPEVKKMLEELAERSVSDIDLKKVLSSIVDRMEQNAEKQLSVLNMIAVGKEFDPEVKKILKELTERSVSDIDLKKVLSSIADKMEENAEKQLNVLNHIASETSKLRKLMSALVVIGAITVVAAIIILLSNSYFRPDVEEKGTQPAIPATTLVSTFTPFSTSLPPSVAPTWIPSSINTLQVSVTLP